MSANVLGLQKMILDGVEWFLRDSNECKCIRMTEDDTGWC